MGKSSPSPPAPPDPAATAAAQGAANLDTAIAQGILNRTSQVTPFGSSTYAQTGSQTVGGKTVPEYTQTVTLSPEQQAMLDKSTAIGSGLLDIGQTVLPQLQDQFNQPIDLSGLPPAFDTSGDPYKRVSDSIYSQYTSRLDPFWDQKQTQLETQLANQGFARGSDAWNKALDDFARQRTDAYNTAMNTAVTGAGSEESRQAALDQSSRQQALSELLMKRTEPINEIATLMGTSPQVTSPSFPSVPQTGVSPTDVTGPFGLAYQGELSNYQTNLANQNAQTQGTMGLIGTLGMAAAVAF